MTVLLPQINLSPMDGEIAYGIIELQRPTAGRLPLILASPHSGSDYPVDFVAASRLDPLALRRSEDSFVDELFGAAPSLGAPLLAARFPRAYLDVNREAYELDPAMFADALPGFVNTASPRVRMGLGTIARIVASGEEIYAGKLRFTDAQRRIDQLYHPYHQALRRLVDEAEALFGGYLLVDCHSMPSAAGSMCGSGGADIVLGDCHGTACAPAILEAARRFFATRGFQRRDQYALRRRVYHRALRRPAAPPTRLAGRDQPRSLHGRAPVPAKAALCQARGGTGRAGARARPHRRGMSFRGRLNPRD